MIKAVILDTKNDIIFVCDSLQAVSEVVKRSRKTVWEWDKIKPHKVDSFVVYWQFEHIKNKNRGKCMF